MKIVLVFPDMICLDELSNWWYPPKEKRVHREIFPPLGLLYLQSNIDAEVIIIDNYIERKTTEQLAELCLSYSPDIVGFGGTMMEWPQASQCANIIKLKNKFVITIYGGPNASARPQKHIKYFDYVFVGMSENSLNTFITNTGNASQIISPENIDINLLSYPNRTNIKRYRRAIAKCQSPTDIVMSSRGCPYACKFCSSKYIWNRSYTERSVESVIDEIKYIIDVYKSKSIHFREDNFTVNKTRLILLCKELKKLNIEWGCQSRINSITSEMLTIMKDAGCRYISCGFESINDSTLQYINKKQTARQVIDTIDLLEKSGIYYTGAFIVATPNENKSEIENTIRFAQKVSKYPHSLLPNYACRFLGIPVSELYYEIIEKGLVEFNWQDGELLFPRTESLSSAQVDDIISNCN